MNGADKTAVTSSPYRGIHPFRYRDRALFFGREEGVSGMLVKVMLSRLTILFGESGTGKSSMLNAGLVPALEKEGFRPERLLIQPDGPIIVERLEADTPGSFLPSIFASDATDHPMAAARTPYNLESFSRIVRASATDAYPVLIFDQFEQLFTLLDRDAQHTQNAILETIFEIINDETLRAKVVIAMREDFLAKLEVLAKEYPRVFDNRVHLQQLDAQRACDAIRKPFLAKNKFDSQIAPALADVVVADLAKESSTGLIHPTHLQIVCARLWNEYASGTKEIGPAEYELLEKVPGIIGGYLESELSELDAGRRANAIFALGGLITETGTRDVVSEGKLRDILVKSGKMDARTLKTALDFLEKQRLVNTTPRRDTLYYEIASEYLIPPVRHELQALQREEERQGLERREREESERRLTEQKLREGARFKRLSYGLGVALVFAAVGWGFGLYVLKKEMAREVAIRESTIFTFVADLNIPGALKLARAGAGQAVSRDEGIAHKIALLELLSGSRECEGSATYLLEKTKHPHRDYIRLMLYWRLGLEGRDDEARKLLNERWVQIDPTSWEGRLDRGDAGAWGEMLVGYFIGKVTKQRIFENAPKTRTSPLSSDWMPHEERRSEAYFYDALLQEVSGETVTRRDRSRSALEEVKKLGQPALYEYHMALYLLNERSRSARNIETPTTVGKTPPHRG